MTVVLGTRPTIVKPDPLAERRAEWVQQFRQPVRRQVVADGPPPVPVQEIRLHGKHHVAPAPSQSCARRDGSIDVYVHRLEAQKARRLTTGRPLQAGRALAQRDTVALGRGTSNHYAALCPVTDRPIGEDSRRERRSIRRMIPSFDPRRSIFNVKHTFQLAWHAPRLGAPRKAVMASLASLIVMASAVTATHAQERYTVQQGDTLESIAQEFQVDPNAIYTSSFMPNGMTVEPGQVIVIPDPGQTPAEASAMAAERQGTSPWVKGAHTVVYGDTLASIATEWGVGLEDLEAANPGAADETLAPGQRILIPAADNVTVVKPETSAAPAPSSGAMISIANYTQRHHLSCEYAATYSATTAFGPGVTEETFQSSIPLAANPHYGYRGNIDGAWGNTTDYGIYPEALVPTLNANGFGADIMYTGGDAAPLKQQLDAGRPVVVWLGFWGDTRETLTDDGTYSVFAGMHVLTAFGYDDGGVYLMDPYRGEQVYYTWEYFTQLWSAIDGMSMAVYPQ